MQRPYAPSTQLVTLSARLTVSEGATRAHPPLATPTDRPIQSHPIPHPSRGGLSSIYVELSNYSRSVSTNAQSARGGGICAGRLWRPKRPGLRHRNGISPHHAEVALVRYMSNYRTAATAPRVIPDWPGGTGRVGRLLGPPPPPAAMCPPADSADPKPPHPPPQTRWP